MPLPADTPAGTATMTLADGRTLAFHSVGVPEGSVLFQNHGGPSSRLDVILCAAAAQRHGLRVIGIDRPGIGLSSPDPGRTLSGWARDVEALADYLGVERFCVTGWSEGGPYALACAASLPADRLALTISVAGGSYGAFGNNWAEKYLNLADWIGGFLALHFQPGFRLMYDAIAWQSLDHPENYWRMLMKSVCPYDQQVCAQSGVKEAFLVATAECFRQGASGLVGDAMLLYRAWDFDVAAVRNRVDFWQGGADTLVPPPINRKVAEAVPQHAWHEVADAGHFIFLGEIDRIFASAAAALR
jgi:pimeloyl-ACP methyl ester carboxylesterase